MTAVSKHHLVTYIDYPDVGHAFLFGGFDVDELATTAGRRSPSMSAAPSTTTYEQRWTRGLALRVPRHIVHNGATLSRGVKFGRTA